MANKIFFKIAIVLVGIIALYVAFIAFIISPKITTFFMEVESKQAKTQLKRVSEFVKNNQILLNDYQNINPKDYEKNSLFLKEKTINTLNSLIKSISEENMGYVYVLNKKGIIILHSLEKYLNKDISTLVEIKKGENIISKLEYSFKNNKELEFRLKNAKEHKDIFSWVNYNEYFDWYIISSIYKTNLEKKANSLHESIISISIFVLCLFLLIGIILIKRTLDPIFLLSKNANLVKKGNLSVRTNIKSNDELGELAKHFNDMLDVIENNTKNLENIVEQRTKQIEEKFYYDELTSLKNRESLKKDIKNIEFGALTIIDIDDFHSINELYGFDIADKILIEVSKILKDFSKEYFVEIYKLDSDKFVIKDTQIQRFFSYDVSFLEKLFQLFKRDIYIKEYELNINLHITLGCSISQDDMIKTANIALKKAKTNRLKFVVYSSDINTKENIENTMFWKNSVTKAIHENRVVPFYHAIFDKYKNIVKYEVLMRIHENILNKDEYHTPGSFMQIAIKTKQFSVLNQMVIKKALSNISKTSKQLSINISFSEIVNAQFNEFLEEQIEKLSSKDREKLVFEILESDNIFDNELLDEFIFKYRKKGIKIAIDDFGSGFSNFSHILKIKPDYIKIDGSLIKNIAHDEKSYEIVKAIIHFCHILKIKTIAEYVHSLEVYEILNSLEVDEFQGFYLSEPQINMQEF